MRTIFICFILVSVTYSLTVQSQQISDTTQKKKNKERPLYLEPYHKNVIKFNPTPMLLFNLRNITFSYERLLKNNHSIAFQAGYLVSPNLDIDTVAGLIQIKDRTRSGVNLAFDYRYYVFGRNTRPAPDGMYMGGYLSYNHFQFNNTFDILNVSIDNTGTMEGSMNYANLGVELGYQFIFWKRMSVDLLLFGPSMSMYSGNFAVGGNLDTEQIEDINEELVAKFLEKFPYLSAIFSDDQLHFTGKKTELDIGFRYSISIGFHF